MASRYNSYDSRSSTTSDPSSSTDFTSKSNSRALVKSKPSDLSQLKTRAKSNDRNLSSLVKKFMDKKSGSSNKTTAGLVIPSDLIAEDLKKTARKGAAFSGLQKKLFGKEKDKDKKTVKALTEVKGNGNTRTLAMVLRSERELLSANKELEMEVAELKLMLEGKNREVDKLKDLCLKQREEIKSLKDAILFPDLMNCQYQEIVQRQGSELKQANQLIPTLQRQVTSLTGQLQSLAEDLAEVKAEKYSREYNQHHGSSPQTPTYDHEEASNSLEFSSSCEAVSPGSPDDMFVKDLNPCLTPYSSKTKSREFESIDYKSPYTENLLMPDEVCYKGHLQRMSKSSDCYNKNSSSKARTVTSIARRSEESKCTFGKQINPRRF